MRIARRFTKAGQDPYAAVAFRTTSTEIRNPDGSVVFHLADMEVPAEWSQVACDILAQKYFRKAGIPARLNPVPESGIPALLYRRAADEDGLADLPANKRSEAERSAKQVFDRLAGTWTYWGWKGGSFGAEDDAQAYFDEMRFMLCHRMSAP